MKKNIFDYDVCFSFAGEDRQYVEKVAEIIKAEGVRVFYDSYEEVSLWGKDLYEHLDDIYKNSARYCVLFASENYAKKLWTTHERKSAQERAFRDNVEYILPAKFDTTSIPGLRDTIGYIDLQKKSPKQLADLIIKKVGVPQKEEYLPPIPNILFAEFDASSKEEKEIIYFTAYQFINTSKRMSQEERELLFQFFLHSCPGDLPDNVHINIDLLSRITNITPSKIIRILQGLRSLGFYISLREDNETDGHIGKQELLVLEWHDLSIDGIGNATEIINVMIQIVANHFCEVHLLDTLCRLDFSQLSESTAVEGC